MKFPRWHRIVSRVVVLPALLIGMSRGSQASGLPPPHVKVGDKAPSFTLTSSDGRQVSVSDFAGSNVLIDFYRGYL